MPQTQMTQAPKLPPAGKETQTSHPGVTSALAAVKKADELVGTARPQGVCEVPEHSVCVLCKPPPSLGRWEEGLRTQASGEVYKAPPS